MADKAQVESTQNTNADAGKPHIPDEVFIETWNKGTSIKQVAETLDREYNSVTARRDGMVAAGIPLKKMPRSTSKRDVSALVELAKASLPEGAELHELSPEKLAKLNGETETADSE